MSKYDYISKELADSYHVFGVDQKGRCESCHSLFNTKDSLHYNSPICLRRQANNLAKQYGMRCPVTPWKFIEKDLRYLLLAQVPFGIGIHSSNFNMCGTPMEIYTYSENIADSLGVDNTCVTPRELLELAVELTGELRVSFKTNWVLTRVPETEIVKVLREEMMCLTKGQNLNA